MKSTIIQSRNIGLVQDKRRPDAEVKITFEDLNEKYIKDNMGIKD